MSRIQFNLLPDVKQDYIKSQRLRNLVISTSVIVASGSFILFLILFASVAVVQQKQLKDTEKNIATNTAKLKSIEGIEEALVVQNQLHTLADLHKNKHISSRLFSYLPKITPDNVSITKLDLDYTTNVMNITGTADNHNSVNAFIDTLKFTTYKIGSQDTAHQAFSAVVESSFGITSNNVSFSLTSQFDPKLFANNLLDSSGKPASPQLNVPALSATRQTPVTNGAATNTGGR
jgi:Tfp pilus assembly protein PilN